MMAASRPLIVTPMLVGGGMGRFPAPPAMPWSSGTWIRRPDLRSSTALRVCSAVTELRSPGATPPPRCSGCAVSSASRSRTSRLTGSTVTVGHPAWCSSPVAGNMTARLVDTWTTSSSSPALCRTAPDWLASRSAIAQRRRRHTRKPGRLVTGLDTLALTRCRSRDRHAVVKDQGRPAGDRRGIRDDQCHRAKPGHRVQTNEHGTFDEGRQHPNAWTRNRNRLGHAWRLALSATNRCSTY